MPSNGWCCASKRTTADRTSAATVGRVSAGFGVEADLGHVAILVDRGPYYRTPYIGQHGWVTLDDPLDHDWSEIRELIVDAYRLAAPKSLAKLLPG